MSNDDADLRRVAILKAGRNAERLINATRIAAATAWGAWRNYGTYKTPEGQVTSTVLMPTIRTQKKGATAGEPGIMIETQLDTEHPEHHRLRLEAEALDRQVLELQDDIDAMNVVAASIRR
jgi:hypothetical protein